MEAISKDDNEVLHWLKLGNPLTSIPSDFHKFDNVSPSIAISNNTLSRYNNDYGNGYPGDEGKQRIKGRSYGTSYTPASASLYSNRMRSCGVFIGLHGGKRSLLKFTNWLRADLEVHGVSCFVCNRSRCRNNQKRGIVNKAMDVSTFGVVILTKKSLRNPYTIEELLFFSRKKNLVLVFFDLGPGDCLVRDIVEKRGELWEKHGGELCLMYEGLKNDWKETINGLSRVDE